MEPREEADEDFVVLGPDRNVFVSRKECEAMSALPTKFDRHNDANDLALMLAEHGVIDEHPSALLSVSGRSKNRRDVQPRVTDNVATLTVNAQPRTDRQSPKQ